MDLGGTWRAIDADEGLRREYPEPDFDDRGWGELAVPGHWRSSPDFAASDGPVLARRTFEAQAPARGRRSWLTFDGVFYQSDVWFDGSYLGDTEGYFFPHTFEITDQLRDRSTHVLATEVTCTPQLDRSSKRNLTGVFQHWDCLDPDWNPGGIWRPVRIQESGPVRIARLRVLCSEATPELAVLSFRTVLDAAEATTVELRTLVGDGLATATQEHRLAAGENRVEWRLGVDDPPLWWPHALGDPNLVDVRVEVRLLDRSDPSDARTVTTGLRKIALDNWIASVNGERLFLKGTNQGPNRMALGEATPDELTRDITLARDAGLDLVRLHAHVNRPETYAAADAAGMLLWQDLPLQWGYARGTRKQAVRQAREVVDLLAHHPSIALWCAHNEPITLEIEPGAQIDIAAASRKTVTGMVLPSWNKTVLDSSLRRALEKADRSRPVIAHSGMPTGDSHLYFGWYYGDTDDLPRVLAAWPRLGRFVSEFGAQALPAADAFIGVERWPDLDWDRLARTHGLQRPFFERNGLDPAAFPTFDAWRDATQQYQADLIRRYVETLRRLKYRPAGGFAQFSLADGHPSVTWSVLDSERNPKLGYGALAAACAPVIVVADAPAPAYEPGSAVSLDVHVVSDRRDALAALTVEARVSWGGGDHRRSWTGDVAADACVRIGSVDFTVPDAPGPLALDLSLTGHGVAATNHYASSIRDCARGNGG